MQVGELRTDGKEVGKIVAIFDNEEARLLVEMAAYFCGHNKRRKKAKTLLKSIEDLACY